MQRQAPAPQAPTEHRSEPEWADDLLELQPTLAPPNPAPRHWPATASPWATALVDLRLGQALSA
jgi:hypothetical protein